MHRFVLAVVLSACMVWLPRSAAAGRPAPGDPAPSFSGPVLGGGEFDLGEHLGKTPVLLDFWSIYCVACMQVMPKLVDLYGRYRDQGLVAVGVNLDSFGAKRVVRFVKGLDYTIPFPLVIDRRRTVAKKYQISVLPSTVVIDRAGNIIYYHVGYSPGDETELEGAIKAALGTQ